MLKKVTLEVLDVLGVAMTAFAALSGVALFLFGGGRPAFSQPNIVWFAPLYLTPLALAGLVLMLVSSVVSKKKRGLLGWSALGFGVLLALTAAAFNLTGLSTGETELIGTFWGTTAIISSIAYALAMLEISGVGVLVAKDISKMESGPPRTAATT